MIDAADHYADSGFDAVRYDAIHADRTRDVAFYVGQASGADGPTLEIGCGTGRVALAIARAGGRVIGLDRSEPMLRVAARRRRAASPSVRRRVAFVRADARAFALRRPVARVFAPFRSLQALLTVPDQLAALRCVRRAVAPGGTFVFDVHTPDPASVAAASAAGSSLEATGRSYADGDATVVERAAVRFDPGTQIATLEYVYETRDGDGAVVKRAFESFRIRWFHRYELEHLLARAGFAVEAVWEGWERGAPGSVGEDTVWVARPV